MSYIERFGYVRARTDLGCAPADVDCPTCHNSAVFAQAEQAIVEAIEQEAEQAVAEAIEQEAEFVQEAEQEQPVEDYKQGIY